jgi:AsmA-like C-terminal region
MTGSPAGSTPSKRPVDIDLDMKLGAVVGYNGEALRSLDLKMSRRAGEIRTFGLTAKIGRDAPLTGELRSRSGARQTIALTTGDGGALFRFTDVYARMNGGQMVIAMDAPSADNPLQQGSITVRQFAIHDEAQLQHAVNTSDPQVQRNVMEFTSMRVDFDKSPGRVVLRDGVVRGPSLGATIDGMIDYSRDELHLRGTLVPLYGPNNLLGQLPIVGLFLGGEKEGLVGITYEVVGKPGNPVLRINPISALAPGLLRKVFEFPMNNGTYDENNSYNYNNNNNNTNYSAPSTYNSNYNNR